MTTVKVPIRWDIMTERQRTRLSRITSRDTRVIRAYLGVIDHHEKELLTGKTKRDLDAGGIDRLTLRTDDRPVVLHDFKTRFPTISVNELQECRETAIAMWKVYLALKGEKPLKAKRYVSRRLPRNAFTRMFQLAYHPQQEIKHWLILRDSLDSARKGLRKHPRLAIPLAPSSYHLAQLEAGEMKSIQIVKDRQRKWWMLFKVKHELTASCSTRKPLAVVAIDLGIEKAACSVVLTPNGLKQTRYWIQKEKVAAMMKYDRAVASLQKTKEYYSTSGIDDTGLLDKLTRLSKKRANISFDYDSKMVSDISKHIFTLSQEYDIHVAIGRLRGIRERARRGNGQGAAFRGMINRWSFARVTGSLKHKLSLLGFEPDRVHVISEAWTSIKCHKCGNTGLRPKQSFFLCHTCGYRDNADRNAAVNIGRRLIKLIPSLRDENGLGTWLLPYEKSTPKTRRSVSSNGRSLTFERPPASSIGGSVADCHVQTSFDDWQDSTDPAMQRTMDNLSAAVKHGIHGKTQQKEATFGKRDHVPMKSDKPHARPAGEVSLVAGDSGHEEG
jgi:transposase